MNHLAHPSAPADVRLAAAEPLTPGHLAQPGRNGYALCGALIIADGECLTCPSIAEARARQDLFFTARTANIDSLLSSATGRSGVVGGTLDSGDDSVTVAFDATSALATMSVQTLSDLAADGFGPGEPADQITRQISAAGPEPDRTMLTAAYAEIARVQTSPMVSLDTDEVTLWLSAHRPDWLLHELITRIVAEDEIDAPVASPEDRHTRLGQVDPDDLLRYCGIIFDTEPRFLWAVFADAEALFYRLAFVLGPDRRIIELVDQVTDALVQAEPKAARAARYQYAGIPVWEAVEVEADQKQRPTDEALDVMAALRRDSSA